MAGTKKIQPAAERRNGATGKQFDPGIRSGDATGRSTRQNDGDMDED